MDHSYSCTVAASKTSYRTFTDVHSFIIRLCYETGCFTVTDEFEPANNIQLTPPHDAVVQWTAEKYIITWKSGYENHPYLNQHPQTKQSYIDYELSLQNSSGIEVHTLSSLTNSTSIERSQLEPHTKYCIKVKSRPSLTYYQAIWSEWSEPTCWTTEPAKEQEQETILLILIKSVGPVCVVVAVLLFIFYNPATRMKIKTLFHTPSPAPFFQPLFQEHKGNLQEWLSPRGNVILQYKTEEIVTTDTLIIVPKPITKDQELQDCSVTQLMFTQCQTSYVGLPGMDGAPLHLTGNCQADTSYTQLPCSALKFSFGEPAVVTCSPEDFLDTSRTDSGCGSEDLTQSPECSLPSSPVPTSLPQCLCDDYCILNKTAAGLIPVLLREVA
ncbi:interleukin-21 receptor-like [Centroberyx affinis]|uniref:interleukin-21 receptor-like n=1 Tax=Centroberyx affinis TaxID=166261 RepID=UPI003A5C5744